MEYTYDIDKYTIGVDENGEDGIGMVVAKVENDGIYILGDYYGENARCIDLLIQENQKLKKQLEEYKDKINWYENFEVNKTIDELRLKHNTQQKEFIKFLENNWKETQDIWYIKILQKYEEIIGVKNEKK